MGFLKSVIEILGLRKKDDNRRFVFRTQGARLNIYGTPKVTHPENIEVGRDVNINDGVVLNAQNSYIKIGNCVTLSVDSKIIAASYNTTNFLSGGESFREHKYSEIHIGNYVWVGAGAIILPQVTVTNHVIIGAGSVVTKSINDEWVLVAGNPARIVKRLK